MFLDILILLSLIPIIVQDFKHREVHLVFFVIFITLGLFKFDLIERYSEVMLSILFFVLIIGVVSLYFMVKNKEIKSIVNEYIGIGDLVFWFGLIFQFSFFQLVIFFNLSCILILALFRKSKVDIPLAGAQSAVLAVVILTDILTAFNRFSVLPNFVKL